MILAEVEFTADSQGIICSQGSRFGGYALFVKGGKVVFTYNFLGIPPEQRLVTDAPKLGKHVIGVEFVKESMSKNLECFGKATLGLLPNEALSQTPPLPVAARSRGICRSSGPSVPLQRRQSGGRLRIVF